MTIERKEVFIFGRWVSLRDAKQILSAIQLPQPSIEAKTLTQTNDYTLPGNNSCVVTCMNVMPSCVIGPENTACCCR